MSHLSEILQSRSFLDLAFIESKASMAFWSQNFKNGSWEKRKQSFKMTALKTWSNKNQSYSEWNTSFKNLNVLRNQYLGKMFEIKLAFLICPTFTNIFAKKKKLLATIALSPKTWNIFRQSWTKYLRKTLFQTPSPSPNSMLSQGNKICRDNSHKGC